MTRDVVFVIVAILVHGVGSTGNAQHFLGVHLVAPHVSGRDKGDAVIRSICKSKRIVRGLRQGLLGPFLDKLQEHLVRRHDRQSARRVLVCAGRLAKFASEHGRAPCTWDDALLTEFLLTADVAIADAFHIRDVYAALVELDMIAQVHPPGADRLRLIVDYDEYLRDVRGITEDVRIRQADFVRQLLAFHRHRNGDAPLRALTGRDVLDLFQQVSERYLCVSTRQKFAGCLRQVLRFLRLRGVIEQDLASTVPLFVNYRLSTVPKHLAWEDVRRLVASVDTTVPPGRRDRAVLLLIVGLGLRPATIRALTLEQIHWRASEIRIPRTKNRRGINLPLTGEIGDALSEYVLKERPKTKVRTVFLRHTAPYRELTSSSAITSMIYVRLDQAGIPRAKGAANLLRHSLATQLVNGGVPIKQVSDIFGHASIDTTAVYTKVDLASLSKVPLAFAMGVTA